MLFRPNLFQMRARAAPTAVDLFRNSGSLFPMTNGGGGRNLFDSIFSDALSPFSSSFSRLMPSLNMTIPVDVVETDKALTVVADLPGTSKENISVSVDDRNVLSITAKIEQQLESTEPRNGSSKDAKDAKDGKERSSGHVWHVRERVEGQLSRQVALPQSADPDKIHAEFKNGVVRITIEKRASASQKSIPVQ
ncbi:mitochondrial Hsp20 family protein [Andalucia godoyi]|uniref:Mitochondrial Hsp20 family protein n=1 Tax=Andalucia godoyi TaxID=505711 RepID=A0A8K0F0H1_ANDGO|nr:mitochondrial Hsp20 family protein [Andalucia godoyi]|eukprot:ANDGO_07908.mRNA.1 mitochondrial Hsp20 family protein